MTIKKIEAYDIQSFPQEIGDSIWAVLRAVDLFPAQSSIEYWVYDTEDLSEYFEEDVLKVQMKNIDAVNTFIEENNLGENPRIYFWW